MNLIKIKQQVMTKLKTIGTMITLLIIKANMVFAVEDENTITIGTAEVKQATDNIERVITSIAMPLRRCTYLCKCSSCSHKNDSQLK